MLRRVLPVLMVLGWAWVCQAAEPTDLVVRRCLPDKLLYNVGETVQAQVTLANPTDAAKSAELRVRVEWEMDEGVQLARQAVTLQPKEEKTLVFPWKAKLVLGMGTYAELWREGKLLSEGHDFANVVEPADALRVSLHTAWPLGQADASKLDRTQYANVYEVTGWGGDPTSTLRPEEYAGHYGWVKKANLRQLCANPLGIRILAYVICYTFKSEAERFAVAHPERLLYDQRGMIGGTLDMESNERQGRYMRYQQHNWWGDFGTSLDWADPGNMDRYAADILASAKDIGWQGVRFDGHPTFIAPYNLEYWRWDGKYYNLEEKLAVNQRNTPYFKDKLRKASPNFLLYYNCEPVLDKQHPPEDLADICRGGSTAGSEVTRHAADVSNPYHKWKDMYDLFIDGVDACRKYGGYYSAIYPPMHGGISLDNKHLGQALSFATGTQPWFVEVTRPEPENAAGLRARVVPYLKTMTRYSALLWGHGIRRVTDAKAWISVTPPAGRELWWERTVQTRTTVGGKELVIINLFNPPPTEENLGTKQPMPAPQEGLRVSLTPPGGKRVVKVWDVCPWPDTVCAELAVTREGGAATVTVPRMDYLRFVVAELAK